MKCSTLVRLAPVIGLGVVLIAPSFAQEVERRERRVVIEVDGDSIRVERDGEVQVVPNTPEGRADLDVPGRSMRFFGEGPPEGAPRVFRFEAEAPEGLLDGLGQLRDRVIRLGDDHLIFRERFEEGREMLEMETELRDLARQIRDAEGADRARLEADLDAKLAEAFARKQQARRDRIADLEKRLAEERDELRAREAASETIIERRKRELLGDEDPLRW